MSLFIVSTYKSEQQAYFRKLISQISRSCCL